MCHLTALKASLHCRDQCQSAAAAIDKLVSENANLTDQLNAAHQQQPHASNGGARQPPAGQWQTELPGRFRPHCTVERFDVNTEVRHRLERFSYSISWMSHESRWLDGSVCCPKLPLSMQLEIPFKFAYPRPVAPGASRAAGSSSALWCCPDTLAYVLSQILRRQPWVSMVPLQLLC